MNGWVIGAVAIGAGAAFLLTRPASAAGVETRGQPQRFAPHARETKDLFTQAALYLNKPQSWATEPAVHELMFKESGGWVGRPNCQFNRAIEGICHPSQAHRWRAEIWEPLQQGRWDRFYAAGVRSAATGLGQMTMGNWDHMPSGGYGIGNAFEEAVALLDYVAGRYGSPQRALDFHNLPPCDPAREAIIREGRNMVSTAFSLGCKHHEGY